MERKQNLYANRQEKNEVEYFLTGIIRQCSKRNKNLLQEPDIASIDIYITGTTYQRQLPGGGPAKPNYNAKQLIFIPNGNQQNQLINTAPLAATQVQAAEPVLVQILTKMQQPVIRPH